MKDENLDLDQNRRPHKSALQLRQMVVTVVWGADVHSQGLQSGAASKTVKLFEARKLSKENVKAKLKR